MVAVDTKRASHAKQKRWGPWLALEVAGGGAVSGKKGKGSSVFREI